MVLTRRQRRNRANRNNNDNANGSNNARNNNPSRARIAGQEATATNTMRAMRRELNALKARQGPVKPVSRSPVRRSIPEKDQYKAHPPQFISEGKSEDGVTRLVGYEFFREVTAPGPEFVWPPGETINILFGLISSWELTARTKFMTQMFDLYDFVGLKLVYIPAASVLAGGQMAIGVDRNAFDGPLSSIPEIAAIPGAVVGRVSDRLEIDVPMDDIYKWYTTAEAEDPVLGGGSGGIIQQSGLWGRFNLALESLADDLRGTTLGALYVHYDIAYSTPQIRDTISMQESTYASKDEGNLPTGVSFIDTQNDGLEMALFLGSMLGIPIDSLYWLENIFQLFAPFIQDNFIQGTWAQGKSPRFCEANGSPGGQVMYDFVVKGEDSAYSEGEFEFFAAEGITNVVQFARTVAESGFDYTTVSSFLLTTGLEAIRYGISYTMGASDLATFDALIDFGSVAYRTLAPFLSILIIDEMDDEEYTLYLKDRFTRPVDIEKTLIHRKFLKIKPKRTQRLALWEQRYMAELRQVTNSRRANRSRSKADALQAALLTKFSNNVGVIKN